MGDPVVWILLAVVIAAAWLMADARREWVFLVSALVMIAGALALALVIVCDTYGTGAFRMFSGDLLKGVL